MDNSFRKYPVNFKEIERYLFKAKNDIVVAKKILEISEEASYKTTYDVMMKITLALIMSYGIRPRTKQGHHITMVNFAKKILGKENQMLIKKYDKMRQKRHLLVYEARWISHKEAKEVIVLAEKYLKIVKDFIQLKNPQKKLV